MVATSNANGDKSAHKPIDMILPPAKDGVIKLADLIVDDSFNARTSLDSNNEMDPKVADIANSMTSAGQMMPIIVEERKGGKFFLVCGFRRSAAAKALGWEEIRARIYRPMTEAQRLYLNVMENSARSDLSAYDIAMACQKLFATGETSNDVAAKLGMSRPYMTNLHGCVTKLCPQVMERWKLENNSGYKGVKACSTDRLVAWSKFTHPEQVEKLNTYLISKESDKEKKGTDNKVTNKVVNADGTITTSVTELAPEPKVRRKDAFTTARTAVLARLNAKDLGGTPAHIVMACIDWALGRTDSIVADGVTLYDPSVHKVAE